MVDNRRTSFRRSGGDSYSSRDKRPYNSSRQSYQRSYSGDRSSNSRSCNHKKSLFVGITTCIILFYNAIVGVLSLLNINNKCISCLCKKNTLIFIGFISILNILAGICKLRKSDKKARSNRSKDSRSDSYHSRKGSSSTSTPSKSRPRPRPRHSFSSKSTSSRRG